MIHYRTAMLMIANLLVFGESVSASLIIHDPRFTVETRFAGTPQTYPLAVDVDGAIYSVTGTATSDDFVRLNTDNTLTTLNGHVGRVIGVLSDIEIAFGGDLFANFAQFPQSSSGSYGVVRFNKTTGAASDFYLGSSFNGDGGLAFDSANSILYLQSQLPNAPLLALDSGGNATTVIANLGDSRGLELEANGTLLTIGPTELRRIDVNTKTASTVLDISTTLPGFQLASLDTLSTGEIVFTVRNTSTSTRSLYSIAAGGGPTNLIATDTAVGPHQLAFGVSRDGLGESLYVNDPNAYRLYELKFTPVPEPTTLAIWSVLGSIGLVAGTRRRRKLKRAA